jgi:hypothetical protein
MELERGEARDRSAGHRDTRYQPHPVLVLYVILGATLPESEEF